MTLKKIKKLRNNLVLRKTMENAKKTKYPPSNNQKKNRRTMR